MSVMGSRSRSSSGPVKVKVWVLMTILLNLTTFVVTSPLEMSDLDQAILYRELEDLENTADHALLANNLANLETSLLLPPPPPSSLSSSLKNNILNDYDTPPLLENLFKTQVRNEIQDVVGSLFRRLPAEGRQLGLKRGSLMKKKRGFDSISQSSGFGMPRGSFGGGNGGSDNLAFTFESLFPAIARGLRSTK